jgi:HEAT repeat protein
MTALIVVLKQDPVEYVRAAAARALGKFTVLAAEGKLLPKDRDRLVETLLCVLSDPREGEEVQRRALEAVAPLDVPEVMNHIRTAYNSNRPKLRCSALSAMGRTCRSEWLPLLLQELKSSDAKIRREAIVGCGELGDRQAVPYLIPLTQEGDLDIQLCAIQALGRLGGRLAKRVLMKCARSDDPRVQDAAQDALELLEAEESALTPVFDE